MHDVRHRLWEHLGYVDRCPGPRMWGTLRDARVGGLPGWCVIGSAYSRNDVRRLP